MKSIIFSEGNGYGHAARDSIISEHFDFQIMTFGKGAEYCKQKNLNFIEIPIPYKIENKKGRVSIATNISDLLNYLAPSVYRTIQADFRKADFVIVDGSPLGLAIAAATRKKAIFITNDTSALVGIHGHLEKKIAGSLTKTLLRSAHAIVVPDFPPPFTISSKNLDASLNLHFSGPLIKKTKQTKHAFKYLVPGNLAKSIQPYLGSEALYGNSDGFSDCYLHSELVFCHGGHTTMMEALSYGKPIISIVDSAYSERVNNSARLQELDLGVTINSNLLSKESVNLAIKYADTLNLRRLSTYSIIAKRSDPCKVLSQIVNEL